MAGAAVDEAQRAEREVLAADQDIGGDVQVVEHRQLLVDEGNAGGLGVGHGEARARAAVDGDAPSVRADDAAQDLHQRALAGAVLADQTKDFAGFEPQRDVVEREDAGVALGDALELEQRGGHPDQLGRSSFLMLLSNSATLDLSMTRVGTMIFLSAGIQDLSPFRYFTMSTMD